MELSLADLYTKLFIVQLQTQGESDACFESYSPTSLHPLIHAIAYWPWINVLQVEASPWPWENDALECTLLSTTVVLAMFCKH